MIIPHLRNSDINLLPRKTQNLDYFALLSETDTQRTTSKNSLIKKAFASLGGFKNDNKMMLSALWASCQQRSFDNCNDKESGVEVFELGNF